MRAKVIAVGLVAVLTASLALIGPAGAAKKKAKPMVVGTDPADDWGANAEAASQPLGDALGQELVEASLLRDKKNINFIIKLNSLPGIGGVPEFSRYSWDFTVNGNPIQLTGAFTEYLRGICNPTYNPTICPPPRDPGQAPFFLRTGGCLVGGACEEIGLVHGQFDPASATITVPVPMKVIKAKPGSKIGPAASAYGGSVYAAPAAFVGNTAAPHDTLTILKTYKVPR